MYICSSKYKCESEVAQSCLTLCNSMDCSLPGSSIHGIFQARVLEWGAIAFSIPGGSDGNKSACNVGDLGLIHGSGKSPREQLPTPVFLPGKFHGQRSLEGYSPWSCKESDMTERLTPPHPNHHTNVRCTFNNYYHCIIGI